MRQQGRLKAIRDKSTRKTGVTDRYSNYIVERVRQAEQLIQALDDPTASSEVKASKIEQAQHCLRQALSSKFHIDHAYKDPRADLDSAGRLVEEIVTARDEGLGNVSSEAVDKADAYHIAIEELTDKELTAYQRANTACDKISALQNRLATYKNSLPPAPAAEPEPAPAAEPEPAPVAEPEPAPVGEPEPASVTRRAESADHEISAPASTHPSSPIDRMANALQLFKSFLTSNHLNTSGADTTAFYEDALKNVTPGEKTITTTKDGVREEKKIDVMKFNFHDKDTAHKFLDDYIDKHPALKDVVYQLNPEYALSKQQVSGASFADLDGPMVDPASRSQRLATEPSASGSSHEPSQLSA